jgi:TolB-like protein/tetratricopeptide (TPR) repeat protein
LKTVILSEAKNLSSCSFNKPRRSFLRFIQDRLWLLRMTVKRIFPQPVKLGTTNQTAGITRPGVNFPFSTKLAKVGAGSMEKGTSRAIEVRFAAFEVDFQSGELRKHGVKVRLQEQPFQILSALIERPREVVTREELRKKLWPDDTFVDFEQSLATAVRKLRRALGDSATHPQFIETLPRRGYRFVGSLEARPDAGKPIVAVLPFENRSGDAGQEYVSDGMAEEIIARLGRLNPERLGVIARASAVRYKNTEKDVDQVGRELGADYVLQGSVRWSGKRMQVAAELVQVNDRTHLWADHFEGALDDVPVFHAAIARHIARSLQIDAPPARRLFATGTSTVTPEAQGMFLRGRYCLNKGTAEGIKNAIAYFEEAAAHDSGYAVAHAGLAVALNLADHFRILPGSRAFPRAKAAALKALELNDSLPEAHNALAFTTHSYDWDWDGAEREYQRAMALNPNFATARHWHGFYLGILGRVDEAIAELRRAQELNPLSIIIRTHLGLMLYRGERYDEAIGQLTQTLEMEPYFAAAHYFLALAFQQKGKYEETIEHLGRALRVSPGSPDLVGALGHAYAVFKRKSEARKALKELYELEDRRFVSAFDFAMIYAGLSEADQAFEWLERARLERSFSMLLCLKAEPRLDPLRADLRFQNLQRQVGLPL